MKKNIIAASNSYSIGDMFFIGFLLLVVFYNFFLKSSHLIGHPGLLGLDPYFFSSQTQWLVDHSFRDWSIGYWLPKEPFYYPPVLVLITGFWAQLFSIRAHEVYRWFGPVQTALFIPILYWTLRAFFNRWPSIIGAVAFSFAPYVMTRGVLTLPENLATLFMILGIGFFARRRWLVAWVVALVGITSHVSAVYLIVFGLGWFIIASRQPYWRKALPFVAIILVMFIGRFYFPSYYRGFSGSIMNILTSSWRLHLDIQQMRHLLGDVLSLLIIPGLVLVLWELFVQKTSRAKFVALFIAPIILVTILFVGQEGIEFGPILAERFGILQALAGSFLIGLLFQYLAHHSRLVLAPALLAFIVTSSIVPWFWVFSRDETAAARWLKFNTSPDSLIMSQPLYNWLIQDEANRYVLGNFTDQSVKVLGDLGLFYKTVREFPSYDHYLFYPVGKQREYVAQDSIGGTRRVGYPEVFLPSVDVKIPQSGQLVFKNATVEIYGFPY